MFLILLSIVYWKGGMDKVAWRKKVSRREMVACMELEVQAYMELEMLSCNE